MAETGRNFQRFVIDGATVDVQAGGGLLGLAGKKPYPANLFYLSQGGLQFLVKKALSPKVGDRLQISVNLKGNPGWLKASAEAVWVRDVPGKAFRRVGCRFTDLDGAKTRLLREAERDFMPRQEAELAGPTGRLIRTFALPPGNSEREVEDAIAAESSRFGKQAAKTVHRPVKLLELITLLENFEVSDELVQGILEAVVQDLSVEDLFGKRHEEPVRPRRVAKEAPQEPDQPKPLPVYRFGRETRLHFSEEGLPVAPPVDHLYIPRFDSSECFCCELQSDRMENNGGAISFKTGDVLIFSKAAKPDSGDFVFGQIKDGNVFAQLFFDDNEHARLRFLNPKNADIVVRRGELRNCCRLVGRLQPF